MGKELDLKGLRIQNIEVIEYVYTENHHNYWKCKCDCGNEIIVGAQNLVRGFPKSCGCVQKNNLEGQRYGKLLVLERTNMRSYGSVVYKCQCDCGNICYRTNRSLLANSGIMGCGCFDPKRKYTIKNNRLYKVWTGIKKRCNSNIPKDIRIYKSRGIKMCKEWDNDFSVFQKWALDNGYKEEILPNGKNKWTIDRIDNNKGYSPDNCRWATNEEQCRNTRKNRNITINGQTKCLAEWLIIYNLPPYTFYKRIKKGFSEAEALTMGKS